MSHHMSCCTKESLLILTLGVLDVSISPQLWNLTMATLNQGQHLTPHIFVGYTFNTKGYKVLELSTKRVHVSRNVIFHEAVFPLVVASNGSSFDYVLNLLVHADKLSFICSQNNISAIMNWWIVETNTSLEITNI